VVDWPNLGGVNGKLRCYRKAIRSPTHIDLICVSTAHTHTHTYTHTLQDLLPKEPTNVIDLERFLTSGQKKRIDQQLATLQKDTGIKVRLLCQRCVGQSICLVHQFVGQVGWIGGWVGGVS
jgi:hypothetical protein